MTNILFLDPTNDNLVILILFKKNKVFRIEKKYHKPLSEVLLLTLEELLKKSNTRLNTIQFIAVVSGPGSFSSLRVGIVVANTLAWSLNIAVVGLKKEEINNQEEILKIVEKKIKSKKFRPVLPFYGREPNITKPKN